MSWIPGINLENLLIFLFFIQVCVVYIHSSRIHQQHFSKKLYCPTSFTTKMKVSAVLTQSCSPPLAEATRQNKSWWWWSSNELLCSTTSEYLHCKEFVPVVFVLRLRDYTHPNVDDLTQNAWCNDVEYKIKHHMILCGRGKLAPIMICVYGKWILKE